MAEELVKYAVAQTEKMEIEAERISGELDLLQNPDCDEILNDPEVNRLAEENLKLKHRLAVLQAACASEAARTNQPKSALQHLEDIFKRAIASAYPNIDNPPVVIALSNKFGDYQCNSAMPLCQILKANGAPKANPRDIATSIMNHVAPSDIIDKMDVAGAGFINIFLNRQYVKKMLEDILRIGIEQPTPIKVERVIVDFSSPNIAKEMHVGHLRSTIIGDSICRLLEFLGHDVLRLNHLGDWGTQFGMLIAHLQDKFPNYAKVSPPISDLQAFYKESKTRFDADAKFKERAYGCVVKLQAFDPEYIKAWNLICEVSRNEFQKIYDRLNIKIVDRGESFYQSRMEAVVSDLKSKGLLEEDEGRLIMWGDENIPLTVVKSDGGFTYDTSDMACIKHRIEEERGERLIYVTDMGQATHFKIIESCAKKAGYLKNQSVEHVGFGVVLGEDKKKFKTRSGDTVRLIELLDEGLKRALDKLIEKERDKVLSPEELKIAQEAVAYGCIKYADLSLSRTNDYVFSFDKMLEDKGNTAVYLLYTFTRIRSIARNAQLSSEDLKNAIETMSPSVEHDKEWKLGKALIRFSEVVLRVSKDLTLHTLCEYLYEICICFTEFYDSCYCIEKDQTGKIVKINKERILLCEATAAIMEQCFKILGLTPVSRM